MKITNIMIAALLSAGCAASPSPPSQTVVVAPEQRVVVVQAPAEPPAPTLQPRAPEPPPPAPEPPPVAEAPAPEPLSPLTHSTAMVTALPAPPPATTVAPQVTVEPEIPVEVVNRIGAPVQIEVHRSRQVPHVSQWIYEGEFVIENLSPRRVHPINLFFIGLEDDGTIALECRVGAMGMMGRGLGANERRRIDARPCFGPTQISRGRIEVRRSPF